MTWTAEVSSVNQQIQLDPENPPGTALGAPKLLKCFDMIPGVNAGTTPYRATGNKYDSQQEEDWEESSLTLNGIFDYNGIIYLTASVCGKIIPAFNGSSAVAYKWQATPPITGSIQPQTYTLQQGDAVRARSMPYLLFNQFGYKWTGKTSPMVTAAGFGQPLSDAITLTSNPTTVTLATAVAKQFSYYLDTTSANIGQTALTRLFSVDFSFGNIYGPFYASNRPTIGPTAHVDLAPKATIKLGMEVDATGLAAMLAYLRSQQTVYFRAQAQGAVIDNLQIVTITGGPTGGTFTVTYKGQTTSGQAYNVSAANLQTAITGLPTVGAGNATVSGSNGGPFSVVFTGTLAQDTTAMTANGGGLTGGSSPGVTVTQSQSYNQFTHDMALKVAKGSPFKDDQGIYTGEWECTVVQDPAWGSGKAQQLTVINLISAL